MSIPQSASLTAPFAQGSLGWRVGRRRRGIPPAFHATLPTVAPAGSRALFAPANRGAASNSPRCICRWQRFGEFPFRQGGPSGRMISAPTDSFGRLCRGGYYPPESAVFPIVLPFRERVCPSLSRKRRNNSGGLYEDLGRSSYQKVTSFLPGRSYARAQTCRKHTRIAIIYHYLLKMQENLAFYGFPTVLLLFVTYPPQRRAKKAGSAARHRLFDAFAFCVLVLFSKKFLGEPQGNKKTAASPVGKPQNLVRMRVSFPPRR